MAAMFSNVRGVQPLGFAALQLFGVYPWQAYEPPGDSLWPMPGVH